MPFKYKKQGPYAPNRKERRELRIVVYLLYAIIGTATILAVLYLVWGFNPLNLLP